MDELEGLLNSAQRGDLAATGELLERFQRMATSYAWTLLGDEHLAQDAVQAAFLEACLHLNRVYTVRAFPSWLRRLVFKQCDRIRRKRHPGTVAFDEATHQFAAASDPCATLVANERIQRVRIALARLPVLERQVALLYYFHGSSRKEIGAFLDLTRDQVAYRLRIARRHFEEQITEMEKNSPPNSEITAVGQKAFGRIGEERPQPELARSIGLLRDQISLGNARRDGESQNLLEHSLEVAELAALIAPRLGLDTAMAQRAGLLHDMGKVLGDGSQHPERGAKKAAELGERPEVVQAIAQHHVRGEQLSADCFLLDMSPLCFALCAADTFSADSFQEGAKAEPAELVERLVELGGGDLYAHRHLFGMEVRALVTPKVSDAREAAPRMAERVRRGMDFTGVVRVVFCAGHLYLRT